MDPEELRERTKQFAHRCAKLAVALPRTALRNHVRGQLIRCSTSVASNYRAACIAQSKAHFVSKLSIVIEEAEELTRICISSRKTAKDRSPEFPASLGPEHNNQ